MAERKKHPFLQFLRKFWGLSAWMLELIIVLSAVLKRYPDLVVVSGLLVLNAALNFMQERRAEGVVDTLRKSCRSAPAFFAMRSGRWSQPVNWFPATLSVCVRAT